MHIISNSRLKAFYIKHASAESGLRNWYKIATKAEWSNLAEVKQTFSSADIVGKLTVFNIGGNNYRLITFIDYESKPKKVFIRAVLTHSEYDKDEWKDDDWNQ